MGSWELLAQVLGIAIFVTLVFVGYVASTRKIKKELKEKQKESELKSQSIGQLETKLEEYVASLQELQTKRLELDQKLQQEQEANRKILSQKKSSETRLGQISEQIAPFLKQCPYDPKIMQFLGNPIDFIVFNYDKDEIVLLEVKSGNSKESARQKKIKNMVKEGKVYYEKLRINDKGTRRRREKNNGQS